MTETRGIRLLLKLAYRGQAWHGPSLLENLDGVTPGTAAQHPIAGAHSIWEIVRHVAAWMAEAGRVLDGKEYVSLEAAADWPPVTDTSESAWRSALAELEAAENALVEATRKLPDEDLEKLVPGKEFSYYVLLHGVLQHNLYHGGQIGLLRKAAH
jgi:uncharacterized damage-inducible protein DinB